MSETSSNGAVGTITSVDELAEPGVALVDFWAEWCGPCRVLSPVVEEVAGEYEGRLRVGKLDVDAHPEVAQRFDVMSIPTLVLLVDGEEKARIVGAVPKARIVETVEEHLAG